MRQFLLLAAMLSATIASSPSTIAAECYISTTPNTIFLNGYYVWGTAKEIREETNGIEGMQRRDSGCTDGTIIPEDVCMLGENLNCPFEFLDHKS